MMSGMNEPTPIISRSEWDALVQETTLAMSAYVPQYLTPVSRAISADEGVLEGTGSYVKIDGAWYLLTNEHVAAAVTRGPLGHMFYGSDRVHPLRSDFATISAPTDAAIARVDTTEAPSEASAVPLSIYAPRHQAVKRELLFLTGYPGARSTFGFNTLFTPMTPYLTLEDTDQSDLLGDHHFAVPWRPDLVQSVDGRPPFMSLPHGMSGSLVWNTRRLECHLSGQLWTPQEARVTGLVFAWSTCANWVYATKVEYLHAAFPQLIASLDL
jgi:hypothetical protein